MEPICGFCGEIITPDKNGKYLCNCCEDTNHQPADFDEDDIPEWRGRGKRRMAKIK